MPIIPPFFPYFFFIDTISSALGNQEVIVCQLPPQNKKLMSHAIEQNHNRSPHSNRNPFHRLKNE